MEPLPSLAHNFEYLLNSLYHELCLVIVVSTTNLVVCLFRQWVVYRQVECLSKLVTECTIFYTQQWLIMTI